LIGGRLYSTVSSGGPSGVGTVFSINPDGTGLTNVHGFSFGTGGNSIDSGVTLAGSTLYGTTYSSQNSSQGSGIIYKVNIDGTGFQTLYNFTALPNGTNFDGANPTCTLAVVGNTIFGVAPYGGGADGGTVFALSTNGGGFVRVHGFTALGTNPPHTNYEGSQPEGGLVFSSNYLYGVAARGGAFGNGTVFAFPVPPQLTITPSGSNVVVTWPTNVPGFRLQSASNVGPSAIWTAVSPAPVIVGGQYTVTNSASGAKYYELIQ